MPALENEDGLSPSNTENMENVVQLCDKLRTITLVLFTGSADTNNCCTNRVKSILSRGHGHGLLQV